MTPSRLRRRRAQGDDGFILATFGLFLVAMMIIAAFAIDVGGWYARAAQLQRGADAAALAGVVWMPDYTTASSVAQTAAAKNGFTNGSNNITVTVSTVIGNSHELKVTITDGNAPRYFSQFVINNQTITKSATAEYVLPLPLGSPKNTFGSGDIQSGSGAENFWAAVNGYCAGRESGDKLLGGLDQSFINSAYTCSGVTPTPAYKPEGYYYTIDVLPGSSGNLNVWLFDPAFDGGRGDASLQTGATVTTTFTLFEPGPYTLQVPSGGTQMQKVTYISGSTTYQNQWVNFWNGPAKVGQYFVQVQTTQNEANSWGSNGFAIQAMLGSASPGNGTTGSGSGVCTTISGQTGYSSTCPQVHGVEDISIFANLGGGSGSTATFYLADVDPVYAGKTMTVTLFDTGEGAQSIQVLDPNGNPYAFTWTTPCQPATPNIASPSTGCSGASATSLSVAGTGTQPWPNLSSTSLYNDRSMDLKIVLPSNYSAVYGTNSWWKIRYTVGSSATDRTTWSAKITGNPVHLVQ
ncbi:MAG: hypothetical protein QOD38_2052 [Acidimicrobiaceae bacterium]